ncbi:hypothetical protein [Algicella marina]|uniref:Uncharacterized protein n=1 Tax=Algicella marina TaxID=2683284 RepID=A0A6P1T3E2_9RHOB|nr:hypothetical protein [Algicella marina]QHQ36193.1 hypothetical protein GO499_13955 [Algicella marina]
MAREFLFERCACSDLTTDREVTLELSIIDQPYQDGADHDRELSDEGMPGRLTWFCNSCSKTTALILPHSEMGATAAERALEVVGGLISRHNQLKIECALIERQAA